MSPFPPGSYIYVDKLMAVIKPHSDFLAILPHAVAHELTHLLLNTTGMNGFDNSAHEPADGRYLMYPDLTGVGRADIIFSDGTRRQLDLTSKWSVERT